MDKACEIEEDKHLKKLRSITPKLPFANMMKPQPYYEVETEDGAAFIAISFNNKKIAVSDNYGAPDTPFPYHTHDGMEVFIVYQGYMEFEVEGEKRVISADGNPYYFDARKKHRAYFPVECRYLAITRPADKGWPQGA